MQKDARRTAELAARTSYGRLLAILASGSRDISAAEDLLSQAFVAALKSWPERGVPDNPDAWLLTAARNSQRNLIRHAKVRDGAALEMERHFQELSESQQDFPDERLKMLFVCAHPAIDAAMRTPLMLQIVLGLDAVRIGSAFLVAPSTMGQRLVRAKAKIRDSGLRFTVPDSDVLPERLIDVLNAIYAAFGAAWDEMPGAAEGDQGLAEEAIYLGRLIASLLPDEPEPKGLLALMLYCHARRAARRDEYGKFVPLKQQDSGKWSRDMIIEAEQLLTLASRAATFGQYQCEAAIQSVHVQRAITGITNHKALLALYDLLVAQCPTVGNLVSRAAMLLEAGDAQCAHEALAALPPDLTARYQPFWVTSAFVALELEESARAKAAFETAIALTEDPAVRTFLTGHAQRATG
ncbi:MAG: RNA polymerase subunit sigma-70 [Sphingomonadaceae bacterium]|nr:RNA polymerase subunit sigma-70 [Sphingomonadaceae bacterium]